MLRPREILRRNPLVAGVARRLRAHLRWAGAGAAARERHGFFGDFASWEEAARLSSGYDTDVILERVRDSLLKVKNGEAVFERDSVIFDRIQYSWPVLASLLWIASRHGNRLSLLDFGGSLGSCYYQNRGFLSHLQRFRWSIVEQHHFVEVGKRDFEDDHLRFYHDVRSCVLAEEPQVVFFSSSLQYLEKPFAVLEEIFSYGVQYILFDLTGFVSGPKHRIVFQSVPPSIYPASYPVWFFNEHLFLEYFRGTYELLADFKGYVGESLVIDDYVPAGYKGFLFRRRGAKDSLG